MDDLTPREELELLRLRKEERSGLGQIGTAMRYIPIADPDNPDGKKYRYVVQPSSSAGAGGGITLDGGYSAFQNNAARNSQIIESLEKQVATLRKELQDASNLASIAAEANPEYVELDGGYSAQMENWNSQTGEKHWNEEAVRRGVLLDEANRRISELEAQNELDMKSMDRIKDEIEYHKAYGKEMAELLAVAHVESARQMEIGRNQLAELKNKLAQIRLVFTETDY